MNLQLLNELVREKKPGRLQRFVMLELVLVLAVFTILALILIPILSGLVEKANIAADNANARLLYQATTIYFSDRHEADNHVDVADLQPYVGDAWPIVRSRSYTGIFNCSVNAQGAVLVATGTSYFNPATGSLIRGQVSEPIDESDSNQDKLIPALVH